MSRRPHLVIDARPRGPHGPLATERVLGRPILAHLIELATPLGMGPITIHARVDEHSSLRALIHPAPLLLATGPPPEGAAFLRTDRLYDATRLRRALQRGRDPESAVIWRLDAPSGLAGAADELTRRRTYQPLGRYWALAPARLLARTLAPTRVRPNALTITAGLLMLGAAAGVAFVKTSLAAQLTEAAALAIALVLDTADGHLARLQGTASAFGRWLDAQLDELSDMALQAAMAWSAFLRDGLVAWLLLGMLYAMGKYLFAFSHGDGSWGMGGGSEHTGQPPAPSSQSLPPSAHPLAVLARLAGHADVRWHLWIVLAAIGRLDVALVAYAFYYPARAMAGAVRKAAHHG
jgi:hypothetical protein